MESFSENADEAQELQNPLRAFEQNGDRRAPKSRALIHDALIRILAEKPLEKITVKEVAAEAGINRKTFYTHYETIADVAKEIEEEIVTNTEEYLQACMIDDYGLTPQYFLQLVNMVYLSNPEFFDHLFTGDHYHFLVNSCKETLKQKMLEGMNLPPERIEIASYKIEFCLGGVGAVFVEWFREGKPVPFETISELALRMIIEGINNTPE